MPTPDFVIPSFDGQVESHGSLSFIAAERATVIASADDRLFWHLLCQITFIRKLGSILVQFPYFSDSYGIVKNQTFEHPDSPTQQIAFEEGGKVTSHLVKYSHPPDGRAHFSQDGKVITSIRRQSFPLCNEGQLFELHAFRPEGFEVMTKARVRKDRAYLPWSFSKTMAPAITVNGAWRRKNRVEEEIVGDRRGPLAQVRNPRGGAPIKTILLGQPHGFPFREHVLVINFGAIENIDVPHPCIVFFGGWDDSTVSEFPGTGCLAFTYPVHNHAVLRDSIGSIDYDPPTDPAS